MKRLEEGDEKWPVLWGYTAVLMSYEEIAPANKFKQNNDIHRKQMSVGVTHSIIEDMVAKK